VYTSPVVTVLQLDSSIPDLRGFHSN